MSIKVAMIVENHTDGTVKPLRFQYEENEELRTMQIKRIIEMDKPEKNYTRYLCEVEDNGFLRQCELRFYRNECTWMLYEIK